METEKQGGRKVVIIGAGPAGLTAAYELCEAGIASVVLEQDETVGGLAKTVTHKDFRFDIGGHRFYTKVEAAAIIWRKVLPAKDFLRRKRLSRIYYEEILSLSPARILDAFQPGFMEWLPNTLQLLRGAPVSVQKRANL